MKYKKGYKYQLTEDYAVNLDINKTINIRDGLLAISGDHLLIRAGYAWDGPSGPAIDTKNFMRGSLIHDALYQLIRRKHLAKDPFRLIADDILRKVCREDGMSALRAWWVYHGVRVFGDSAATDRKEVFEL